MKKLLVVLLAAAMCLSMLAGCSKTEEAPEAPATEASTETKEEAPAEEAAPAEKGDSFSVNI